MTTMTTATIRLKQRCKRCGGFAIFEDDALACLLCGHRYYGAGFKPLGLDMVDRWLESEPDEITTEHGKAGRPRLASRQ
jgi:hypothetical protein